LADTMERKCMWQKLR